MPPLAHVRSVFSAMSTAFMKPYVAQFDALLSGNNNLNIVVYEGQLDVRCGRLRGEARRHSPPPAVRTHPLGRPPPPPPPPLPRPQLICATVGAERWMDKLTWAGYPAFKASAKTAVYPPGTRSATGGFRKSSGKLAYYTIMNAGHMVPADNGPMALAMLKSIIGVA